VSRADLVDMGKFVCTLIGMPGVTRQNLEEYIGPRSGGPVMAKVIIDAAHSNLCTGKPYSQVLSTTEPPAPAGPATTMAGDGTYEVGVDVVPGKYKTAGSPQGSDSQCYWARVNANGEDIIDNDLGNGPKIVTIKAGELFETQRCGTWTKS
jgi:hypothetical protein